MQLASGTPRGEGEALPSAARCWRAHSAHHPACELPQFDGVLSSTQLLAGAKVVARLAFKKIKALQANLAEQRQALANKEAAVASLQQTISGLQEAASQRDAAVQAAEARVAEVRCMGRGSAGGLHCLSWCAVLRWASDCAGTKFAPLVPFLSRLRRQQPRPRRARRMPRGAQRSLPTRLPAWRASAPSWSSSWRRPARRRRSCPLTLPRRRPLWLHCTTRWRRCRPSRLPRCGAGAFSGQARASMFRLAGVPISMLNILFAKASGC